MAWKRSSVRSRLAPPIPPFRNVSGNPKAGANAGFLQAVAILRELHSATGDGRYLFPSVRSAARPRSDNTLNAALRRLGYTMDDM